MNNENNPAVFIFRILFSLMHGRTASLQGFVKALAWTFKTMPDTIRERRRLQNILGLSDIYRHKIIPMLRRSQAQFLS